MSAIGPDDPLLDEIALNPKFRHNEGALLRALLQATDYGILLSGLDRQDILANDRMGQLFSCAPHEIVRSEPELVRRQAQARVRLPEAFEETLHRAYADPSSTFEDELVLIDDPPRTLRRFTGPVLDHAGRPLGRLWTFLDITEMKRLQAAIEAQLRARTSDFEATQDILQSMTDVCRLATENVATEDLLRTVLNRLGRLRGLRGLAILSRAPDGKSAGSIALPHGRDAADIHPCAAARALDRLLGLEPQHARPPTSVRDEDAALAELLNSKNVRAFPLQSESKVFGMLLLAFSPDSGEAAQARYRSEQLEPLADQVAQTLDTHRLQSQLRDTVRSLRAAQGRMVEVEKLHTAGTLAVSVAHDIRNILSTLQMEMDLIPGSAEPLRQQLNRFSTLTHRLLAYARPGVLELSPTSLSEVIRRVVALVRDLADVHCVQLRWNPEPVGPWVAADANQLDHLFVNLCLNAVQAMAETGGTLSIGIAVEEGWTITAIEDTGPGIASDALPRLFDAFFTTRATGFGLGLFSCKRIVEEHGGEIEIENLFSGGARSTVRLPSISP